MSQESMAFDVYYASVYQYDSQYVAVLRVCIRGQETEKRDAYATRAPVTRERVTDPSVGGFRVLDMALDRPRRACSQLSMTELSMSAQGNAESIIVSLEKFPEERRSRLSRTRRGS